MFVAVGSDHVFNLCFEWTLHQYFYVLFPVTIAAIDVGGSTKIIFQASDALENDGTSNLPLVSMDYNPANPIHLRIGLDALSTEVLLSYIALSGGFIRVE